MSDDEKMDALLRQMAAEEYNRPPQIVPREQMWDAVLAGIAERDSGNGEAGSGKRFSRSLAVFRGGCTSRSRRCCCSRWGFRSDAAWDGRTSWRRSAGLRSCRGRIR